jgi:hypothetical protein
VTGWVFDFSEAESAQKETALQINGVGTGGLGLSTMKSAGNLDIVPVDFWKTQSGKQTPSSTKYRNSA